MKTLQSAPTTPPAATDASNAIQQTMLTHPRRIGAVLALVGAPFACATIVLPIGVAATRAPFIEVSFKGVVMSVVMLGLGLCHIAFGAPTTRFFQFPGNELSGWALFGSAALGAAGIGVWLVPKAYLEGLGYVLEV